MNRKLLTRLNNPTLLNINFCDIRIALLLHSIVDHKDLTEPWSTVFSFPVCDTQIEWLFMMMFSFSSSSRRLSSHSDNPTWISIDPDQKFPSYSLSLWL